MSTAASELNEKLRRRLEAVEGVGASFESQPDKSVADVQRVSPDKTKAKAKIVAIETTEKRLDPILISPRAKHQDFEKVMSRQRKRTEEGSQYESSPQPTAADAHRESSAEKPQESGNFESAPEATQADLSASSASQAKASEVRKLEESLASALPASEEEAAGVAVEEAGIAADLMKEVVAGVDAAGSDSSDAETDEDMPELEGGVAKDNSKQNRGEKKSRKAVSKLGMKPVAGITRVTMKKAPQVLFVIERPEVFKGANSATFIVFGEARIEDLSAQAQASAAERVTSSLQDSAREAPHGIQVAAQDEDEDEEVDESGMEPKDIELVVTQANVSRAQAIRALKANNNDIVEAIMALSSG
jgi:nascent polypeptide-associated complex subunit alpha